MAEPRWTPSPNLPPCPASFAEVGRAEMLARARGLLPALRERAARCEAEGRMLDDTERDLHALGLFRFAQPARVGGADLDVGLFVDICAELAVACPSTAWNVGNLAAHHWMLGYFPPMAQDELWGLSPDVLIATSLAFPCGRGRRVEGGYVVDGRWPFSSGVDNCDWNMLAVSVRDGDAVDRRFMLLNRSQYRIIDNWDAMGLKGTGSKDVAAEGVFVPEYRTTPLTAMTGGPHVGSAVNPSPLFRLPMMAIGGFVLTGVALGCAEGAWQGYVAAAKSRNTTYGGTPVGGYQAVQIKIAEAGAKIDAARLLMQHDCREAMEIAEAGGVPDLDRKLRWRRDAAWTVGLCVAAVDLMMTVSGAAGLYNTGELQRYFRDAHAAAAHIMYAFDVQATMFGQHALGIPGPPPVL
jgi:3-hydroxy-9,10-secoandrosta-1,3,5(10)-triene-9,17-dione monooxygenase